MIPRVITKSRSIIGDAVRPLGNVSRPYSSIMEAMDTLRASGIEDVGLITDSKAQSALGQGGK